MGVAIRLAFDAVDPCNGAQSFAFVGINIMHLSPAFGPNAGGTVIVIEGTGFPETSAFACMIGLPVVR